MAWESQGYEILKVHYSMDALVSKKFLVWNGLCYKLQLTG